MDKFFNSNSAGWRLCRTIVQGVLGVLIANLDLIVGMAVLDPTQRVLIVAFVMAVLSPIFKQLGDVIDDKDADFYVDLMNEINEEDEDETE